MGIGEAIALKLAEQGVNVSLLSRSKVGFCPQQFLPLAKQDYLLISRPGQA
jgi:hypothetical protein